MDSEDRAKLIDNYGKASGQIAEAISQFPVEMWQFKPTANQWSIHEIIIHLADSEVNSYHRCRRFIAEAGSKILAYDQDKWAENLHYHNQDTNDALQLFGCLRKMTYNLIKNLPEQAWSNVLIHEHLGEMTLNYWLEIYEEHIPGHIRQMNRVFEEWKKHK